MRAVRLGALSLLFPIALLGAAFAQPQQNVPDAPPPQGQNATPNAPTPQPGASGLPNLRDQVTPGKGTGATDDQTNSGNTSGNQAPHNTAPPPPPAAAPQEGPPPGYEAPQSGPISTIRIPVNAVMVPVTVRDKHGALVSGLPPWRFAVYEDGVRQRIWYFSTDQMPLSIAFVIDATLPADVMQKVNQSLSAVTGALTPADTVAVISYAGTSPQLITDFTAAEGARLPAALSMAKKPGQQPGVPIVDGPFAGGPTVNGLQADPTLAPQPGNAGGFIVIPKEAHPLNDAILYAGEQLASQPQGRRRIIYVISDGRNLRSKASFKEVVQYLLTNNISVYGTNVGDSALWGIGYFDRMKLPLLQAEDVLPRYAIATGGDVDHQLSENGIQNAFVQIASEARTQYTLVYNSHQPTISGKYHSIDVRIEGLAGLQVDAKQGYYPNGSGND
ncbi:MAG TPA: VWA domain-containing protein [Acidobacteriaceae bacterium]|nr:VWA domain-containing protein [Acidobacteriaceae bacterium]